MPLAVTGTRHLLELADEPHVLVAFRVADVVGALEQQVADEVEDERRLAGVAPLGFERRVLDVLAVALADRLSRAFT